MEHWWRTSYDKQKKYFCVDSRVIYFPDFETYNDMLNLMISDSKRYRLTAQSRYGVLLTLECDFGSYAQIHRVYLMRHKKRKTIKG